MGKQQARKLRNEEAMRRIIRITPLLAADTWYALRVRAALQTANDVIWEKDFSRPSQFGDSYNVIQNSLALTVAMAVARLFDISNPGQYPVEEQDKASVQVLAHLFMRKDAQEKLVDKAREWVPQLIDGAALGESDCRRAISSAIAVYETFANSSTHQDALARVREFRTSRLAHHLFDNPPTDLPRFDDLVLLANCARDFARWAVLAVEGIDRDLGREEEIKRDIDRRFWEIGLSAVLTVAD